MTYSCQLRVCILHLYRKEVYIMNYEEVYLEEKTVVGIGGRTRNTDSNMPTIIGDLWKRFLEEGIYESIKHKKAHTTIGLYDCYGKVEEGAYDITVGTEVCEANEKEIKECIIKKIPRGKYAKFVVKGHMQKAIADFWEKLWQMDLSRSYQADFEEYVSGDIEECEIHIYIALK